MKAREPRRKVMLNARMRIGAAWRDTRILNLSSRGLLIQASDPLRHGSYVELRRGRHVIVARVMWSHDRRYGLWTQDPVPAEAFIAEPEAAEGPALVPNDRRVERAGPPRAFAHERSRWRARSFEFGLILVIGGACGTFAYDAVRNALSMPLLAVETALAGG